MKYGKCAKSLKYWKGAKKDHGTIVAAEVLSFIRVAFIVDITEAY